MSQTLAGRRVLVCVCGGVAAVKVPALITELRKRGAEVRVAMTPSAVRFVTPVALRSLSGHPVSWRLFPPTRGRLPAGEEGAGMAHLDLSSWAECNLVVPATANTIARLATGLADEVVSSTLLASTAPILLAPAMETAMWRHRATRANLATLLSRGASVVGPASGRLASGREGEGRMAEPEEILRALEELLLGSGGASANLRGWRVLVTAGGTREPIDPVRYLGNRSSGRTGFALAQEAARRGARVVLVTTVPGEAPPGVEVVLVDTAEEMRQACRERLAETNLVLMAAAVADFRPAEASTSKLHRQGRPTLELELVPTVDVLADLLANRPRGCAVVGFAAETEEVLSRGQAKLRAKRCDMLVANPVTGKHSAMGGAMAEAYLLRPDQPPVRLEWQSKEAMAIRILDAAAALVPPSV